MGEYKKLLWKDLETDTERAEFIECGRAHDTGIIAKAIEKDLAKAYRKCAMAESTNENSGLHLQRVSNLVCLHQKRQWIPELKQDLCLNCGELI